MKTWRWLILLLSGLILWLLDRQWNERFVMVKVESADVDGQNGRRLTVQSALACTPEKAWAEVQKPALLARVAAPLLGFKRQNGEPLPAQWQVGETVELTLQGFMLLPLGSHNIHLVYADEEKRELLTNESGELAQIWNHRVAIEPSDDGQTLYTDEIDIYAGILTPFIVAFAYFFYRHRQTNWQKLAPTL